MNINQWLLLWAMNEAVAENDLPKFSLHINPILYFLLRFFSSRLYSFNRWIRRFISQFSAIIFISRVDGRERTQEKALNGFYRNTKCLSFNQESGHSSLTENYYAIFLETFVSYSRFGPWTTTDHRPKRPHRKIGSAQLVA
jgi:hypothetical protein